MPEKTTHFYPDALLIFVKGFRSEEIPREEDITIVSTFGNGPLELGSVSVNLTVKNSPGTFSATLIDKANRFIVPDNPELEISELRRRSMTRVQQYSRAPVSGGSGLVTTGREKIPGANYYEFGTYQSWLDFTWATIEEISTGEIYPVYYKRDKTGNIVERWAFSAAGDIVHIVPAGLVEAESIFQSLSDGSEVFYSVLRSSGTQDDNVRFIVHKYSNDLFVKKYKDREEQGVGEATFERGRCKISPMDRVVIFMSRRFTDDGGVNQSPRARMIRTFTGLVNTVEQSYQGNQSVINIQGEDITKFMRLSVVNINPSLILDENINPDQTGEDKITPWNDIFRGLTAPQIVKILLLGGKLYPEGLGAREIQGIGEYVLGTAAPHGVDYDPETDTFIVDDNRERGGRKIASFRQMLGELFSKNTVNIVDPFKPTAQIDGFRPYEVALAQSWNLYQSDYKTRRDLVYSVAEDTHFVFYADRNGHIHFHPPKFSNVHILGAKNPEVYIVRTEDIISYGFIEDDSTIFTSVYIDTEPDFGAESAATFGLYRGAYREDSLVLKYGQRIFSGSNPLIRTGSSEHARLYAKSLMQRMLAGRYQGQVTITGRAEIDPGRPVYIPIRNMIYYVETVSHSLTFGSNYQTVLHLSYGRKPWEYLPEILTFSNNDEIYAADASVTRKQKTKEDAKEESLTSLSRENLPESLRGPDYSLGNFNVAPIDSTFVDKKIIRRD